MATSDLKHTNSIGGGDTDNWKKTEPIDDGIDWALISKSKPNLTRCVSLCSRSKRFKRIREEMVDTIEKLRVSKLYCKIRDQWKSDCEFQLNMDRVVSGSNSQMTMVINNLGTIESGYRTQYQLAFAILLQEDFPHWISGIEVSNRGLSPIDTKVIESFGCYVLPYTEEFTRQIDKPTLFYVPCAFVDYPGYLLKENWCPFCLNQMILLTDSFKGLLEYWRKLEDKPSDSDINKESVDYLKAINQEHVTLEFPITPEYPDEGYLHPFDELSCHFFHLDPQLNMDSLLHGSTTVSPDIYWPIYSESYYEEERSNFFTRLIKCSSSDSCVEDEIGTDEEITTLTEEMETSIAVLKESKLYEGIQKKWEEDPEFQSNINRVLGSNSDSKLLMVIYGLGSIESSYRSQFQLALAILLRDGFDKWISGIEAYDPVISKTDAKVMEGFHCKVLTVNEECRRRIEKPTLFYMPFALNDHKGNLLETNWSPSCLNQMIMLTSSFEHSMKFWLDLDDNPRDTTFWRPIPHHSKDYFLTRERVDYIEAIQKYTEEIVMTRKYYDYGNPLNEFSCHFFNLDPQLDMTSVSFPEGREKRLKILSRLNKKNKLLWSCIKLFQSD